MARASTSVTGWHSTQSSWADQHCPVPLGPSRDQQRHLQAGMVSMGTKAERKAFHDRGEPGAAGNWEGWEGAGLKDWLSLSRCTFHCCSVKTGHGTAEQHLQTATGTHKQKERWKAQQEDLQGRKRQAGDLYNVYLTLSNLTAISYA